MVVRSLNVHDDPFRPCEDDEEILGPEIPYLSAIGALMYLANNTRPDIAFSVNLLARYSSSPTRRHWNGVKHIFRYLNGTIDLGLYFKNGANATLIGYADAGYLSDPQKAKSQTGYLFTYGDTAISWRSMKQTLTATSSNHAELIALYEAGRECVWLRSMIQHIQNECGMDSGNDGKVGLLQQCSSSGGEEEEDEYYDAAAAGGADQPTTPITTATTFSNTINQQQQQNLLLVSPSSSSSTSLQQLQGQFLAQSPPALSLFDPQDDGDDEDDGNNFPQSLNSHFHNHHNNDAVGGGGLVWPPPPLGLLRSDQSPPLLFGGASHHHQHQVLAEMANNNHNQNFVALGRGGPGDLSSPPQPQPAAKKSNPKKRSRASRRAPTTVLTTDTSNFRQMVQEFTGIPAGPFSGSAGGLYSRRLDLFSGTARLSASMTTPGGRARREEGISPTNNPLMRRPSLSQQQNVGVDMTAAAFMRRKRPSPSNTNLDDDDDELRPPLGREINAGEEDQIVLAFQQPPFSYRNQSPSGLLNKNPAAGSGDQNDDERVFGSISSPPAAGD
ncbi:unnamed protein product [Cuscuta epithymum]|uniref:VQ domain-containing protein n=1 Tax=Cuscuta epithymum TaxID=186058 RepID=A0AAV0GG37_9ASTE|nr:unnamed protein product [Cuscuta epithymum]